jgi:hypothetical protein
MSITGNDNVYEYIVDLFDSRIESGGNEASAASVQIDSPDAQILTPSITGTLTAGQIQSITVPVEVVTTAGFVVMGDGPLTVTLLTPAGQTIDPATPAVDPNVRYDAQGDTTFWYYQYRVETPADGLWQIRIEAAAITEFEAFAVGASPLLVHIFRDQGIYRPGETITLETSVLEEPGTLHTGFAFTATVQLPDGSAFTLTFHDDGVQGDKARWRQSLRRPVHRARPPMPISRSSSRPRKATSCASTACSSPWWRRRRPSWASATNVQWTRTATVSSMR